MFLIDLKHHVIDEAIETESASDLSAFILYHHHLLTISLLSYLPMIRMSSQSTVLTPFTSERHAGTEFLYEEGPNLTKRVGLSLHPVSHKCMIY